MNKPQILKITSWEKYSLSRQTISKHRKDSLIWVPVYVDSWLMGSIHFELEPDEQATFLDLLLLAGKDDGYIRANEITPYSFRFLAGYLNKPQELIERTIEKCLRPEIGKLEVVPLQNCQPPLQDRQGGSKKPIARVEKSREEKKREEDIIDEDKSSSQGTTSSLGLGASEEGGVAPSSSSSSSSKAQKRKPFHEWTDEEIGDGKTVPQCHAVWDRAYFRLTGHPPDRNYAKDGAKFKRKLGKGIDLKTKIREFFKHIDDRGIELGGYTVGVFEDWCRRMDALNVKEKREEQEARERRLHGN